MAIVGGGADRTRRSRRMLGDAGVSCARARGAFDRRVTTGNTTGKLSLLQGDVFSEVARPHRRHRAARIRGCESRWAGVAARRAGRSVPEVRSPEGSPSPGPTRTTASPRSIVRPRRWRLPGSTSSDWPGHDFAPLNLPFEPAAALRLRDQTQLHPMRVLAALTGAVRNGGIRIVEGCRVTAADVADDSRAARDLGRSRARRDGGARDGHADSGPRAALRQAGAAAFLRRGLRRAWRARTAGGHVPVRGSGRATHFALTRALVAVVCSSWAAATTPTGRGGDTGELLADLDEWTARQLAGRSRVTWWAAQDYRAVTRVPYAGPAPRSGGRIHVATGYDKWGDDERRRRRTSDRLAPRDPGPPRRHRAGMGAHSRRVTTRA